MSRAAPKAVSKFQTSIEALYVIEQDTGGMLGLASRFILTATPGQSTVVVRAPAEDLTALNATLNNLLEDRSQMQLDVAMYEVDRTKATNMGAIIPTQTNLFNVYSEAASVLQANSSLVQEIISSGLAAPGDWPAILAILIASGQLQGGGLLSSGQPFPA